MIVGPNSHFVHEIGRRNRRHKIAMTEALKPMIVVSWNINRSMRHGEDSKICERVSEMHPLNGTKTVRLPQRRMGKPYKNRFDPETESIGNLDTEDELPSACGHF